MRQAGDRWSLMLQLTSNLASAIIKPSLLDVSLCSHRTPSAQTQKSHFVSQGSETRLCLGECVCVLACLELFDWSVSACVRVDNHRVIAYVPFQCFFNGLCNFSLIQSEL